MRPIDFLLNQGNSAQRIGIQPRAPPACVEPRSIPQAVVRDISYSPRVGCNPKLDERRFSGYPLWGFYLISPQRLRLAEGRNRTMAPAMTGPVALRSPVMPRCVAWMTP